MVFLNGIKTSGMVKLSFSIQVTCLIIIVFRCRGTRYAPESDGRGERSDVRRWVGECRWREDATGG